MRRIMVNFKPANIFKGILGMQNSTRNGENFAKIRALATWRPRVYHAGINYDAALLHERGLGICLNP
jgi:hypothetical protein